MRLEVTQKMIDEGCKQSCRFCPVANAIRPFIKDGFEATVGPSTVNIRKRTPDGTLGAIHAQIALHYDVTDFIRKFDRSLKVQPFSFDIDIPALYLKEPNASQSLADSH